MKKFDTQLMGSEKAQGRLEAHAGLVKANGDTPFYEVDLTWMPGACYGSNHHPPVGGFDFAPTGFEILSNVHHAPLKLEMEGFKHPERTMVPGATYLPLQNSTDVFEHWSSNQVASFLEQCELKVFIHQYRDHYLHSSGSSHGRIACLLIASIASFWWVSYQSWYQPTEG